jgi:D-glycero-alpha-D-manno-heptose 1-phosphate guanylyltransferase
MEVIILAGGLGTRLRSVVEDLPKCMAPVAGKPFLEHILQYLETQFVDHVILSLGYKHDVVIDWLRTKAFTFKVSWVIEKEPLGTGGGLQLAVQKAKSSTVFVLNGDTFFPVNLRMLQATATATSPIVVALKPMENFERYGTVIINESNDILSFKEKQPCEKGLINGGVYYINNHLLKIEQHTPPFSFEQQILETTPHIKALVQDVTFIDIGIPDDYEKAQTLLAHV